MDGVDLLFAARAAGLTLRADGDRLVIRGPKASAATAELLLVRKDEVLADLRNRADLLSVAETQGWPLIETDLGRIGYCEEDWRMSARILHPRTIAMALAALRARALPEVA